MTRTVSPSYYIDAESSSGGVFRQNEIVRITSPTTVFPSPLFIRPLPMKDPNWYRARSLNRNEDGLVHSSFVRSTDGDSKSAGDPAMPWYHPGISRDEAER